MENNNYYGRGPLDNAYSNGENANYQSQTDSTVYSYSYVNPQEGQENPNETTGYRREPERSYSYYNPIPEEPEKKKKDKNKTSFGKFMAKTVAAGLVFGILVSGIFVGTLKLTGTSLSSNGSGTVMTYKTEAIDSNASGLTAATDVADIVESVMPSIVAITNTEEVTYQSFFGYQTEEQDSAGSGIIIGQDDDKIYIATNKHVVANSVALSVTFANEQTVAAEVKGTATGSDLAVVTVNLKDMDQDTKNSIKIAVLGNSEDLRVGESVIAIGNALGYGQSVTTGVVSALNRSITVDNDVYSNLLQVDAAINPGNSGGALLNSKGEVIGINSAKYSDTSVEGIGYAIPISDAQEIIENIISREDIAESEKGYLGIYGTDVTDDVASVYNLPIGVYVNQLVTGGAAEAAGLQPGDIITALNGTSIDTMSSLQNELGYYKAGTSVELTIMRAGSTGYEEQTVTVTLQTYRENN